MTNEQHPELTETEAEHIARRQDQGVWNWTMGEAATRGAFAENEAQPRHRTSDKTKKSRRSRPLPLETSGETVSRDIANRFALENPAPANQSEINARGRELLRQIEKGLK